jgi:chromosome segregation ATPase
MSEDLTKKLTRSDKDEILTAIQGLDARIDKIDSRLQSLEAHVDNIDSRLLRLEAHVDKIDSRLLRLEAHVDNIDSRLLRLEQKVDERLYDTRPLWHKVVDDIAQLQAGQKRLEDGQQALRGEISELNNTVRNVNRDQIVINDVVHRIQLDFHNVDERLHRLIVNYDQPNSST